MTYPDDPANIHEFEDLPEDEKDQIEKRIFRQVLTDDPAKVEAERDDVEKLLRLSQRLRTHEEAKFSELRKVLDSSGVIRSDEEKLLIFTEHRDTLESLAKKLKDRGYTVTTIHGGMDIDERKRAQRDFRTKDKIMVATDAAGEGINLQFCRYLINWDIPWNPNRLEQRMGRIHRYGQKGDVHVYNLVASNTREGAVLQKVLTKMDVMRDQMGSDRVYDVIDEWLEGVPLTELIEKAIDSDDIHATEAQTEAALVAATQERVESLIAVQKKASLASRLDLRAARELRDASDEKRLQPFFIQRFFERAWKACGGTIRCDDQFPVWHLGRTPTALVDLSAQLRSSISDWTDMKKDHILFRERMNYEQLEVPIVPKLRSILDEYPNRVGRIVDITLGQMSHGIKEYLRRAGLNDLRPHDLRHTFASHLLMAGVDITTVQRLLGHSNVSTTSEFYAHITEEHKKAAINKLPY